jgi:hypothetical protein
VFNYSRAIAWSTPFTYQSARRGPSSHPSVQHRTALKENKFKCSSNSIDIRLSSDVEEHILPDGTRNNRGKIFVNGTFWSITDRDRVENGERQQQINVVTVLKTILYQLLLSVVF